jgi:hypothetical protein
VVRLELLGLGQVRRPPHDGARQAEQHVRAVTPSRAPAARPQPAPALRSGRRGRRPRAAPPRHALSVPSRRRPLTADGPTRYARLPERCTCLTADTMSALASLQPRAPFSNSAPKSPARLNTRGQLGQGAMTVGSGRRQREEKTDGERRT